MVLALALCDACPSAKGLYLLDFSVTRLQHLHPGHAAVSLLLDLCFQQADLGCRSKKNLAG